MGKLLGHYILIKLLVIRQRPHRATRWTDISMFEAVAQGGDWMQSSLKHTGLLPAKRVTRCPSMPSVRLLQGLMFLAIIGVMHAKLLSLSKVGLRQPA